MSEMGRVLGAELLKLKRTLAFRMVFVAPLLGVLLTFFVEYNRLSRMGGEAATMWKVVTQQTLGVWAIFLMPLLITLEAALLTGIEHGEKQWKHLFALPVRRTSVFAAKWLVLEALALASSLVVAALVLPLGYGLMAIFPKMASAGAPPVGLILRTSLSCWLAAGLLLSIQLWVSLRWPSFAMALGSGIGGSFFALFAASAKIGKYYPWLLPVNAINERVVERMEAAFWLGIVGGLVMAGLACVDFVRREESAPPGLGWKAMVVWGVLLCGFVGYAVVLQREGPKKQSEGGGGRRAEILHC